MPPKKRTSLGSIIQSGKKSRLLRLTESSLQTQQRLPHQRIRQANLRASEELYKLSSVYRNNALDKKTYGHLKRQFKLNSDYSNNAIDKTTYGHLENLYRLNSVYRKNALGMKTYGRLKNQ
ncbi:hypothetical protein AVEN_133795-1 [Araneus ventricosus]|uniref:Uncharacterized protein n=1 Tax=Araneus ventricosus TaxID=182803 RepID=A0A4Y2L133_ARAVE|nr:hypothetical protein AVEN_133795-1 [Araneus ventricosus]